MRVGLVSDTHDLLRPAVLDWLRGSDHIVHAGDICSPHVLDALRELAPVTAVRGNNDRGGWAGALREIEVLALGGVTILVIHDLKQLRDEAAGAGATVVVSGHSHRPAVREEGGITYVNPGSAGPRRFKLPVSAGELLVARGHVQARLQSFAA